MGMYIDERIHYRICTCLIKPVQSLVVHFIHQNNRQWSLVYLHTVYRTNAYVVLAPLLLCFPSLMYYPKALLSIDRPLFKEALHDQRKGNGISLTCSLIKHIRKNWIMHHRRSTWAFALMVILFHCFWWSCDSIECLRIDVVISTDLPNMAAGGRVLQTKRREIDFKCSTRVSS